jgi:uncharacterized integral membrane protein
MAQKRDGATTPQPVEPGPGLAHQIRVGTGIVAIAALLLFFAQNLQEVQMHFLWFDWSTRLIFALFVSAAVGGVASWLVGALRRRGQRTKRDIS